MIDLTASLALLPRIGGLPLAGEAGGPANVPVFTDNFAAMLTGLMPVPGSDAVLVPPNPPVPVAIGERQALAAVGAPLPVVTDIALPPVGPEYAGPGRKASTAADVAVAAIDRMPEPDRPSVPVASPSSADGTVPSVIPVDPTGDDLPEARQEPALAWLLPPVVPPAAQPAVVAPLAVRRAGRGDAPPVPGQSVDPAAPEPRGATGADERGAAPSIVPPDRIASAPTVRALPVAAALPTAAMSGDETAAMPANAVPRPAPGPDRSARALMMPPGSPPAPVAPGFRIAAATEVGATVPTPAAVGAGMPPPPSVPVAAIDQPAGRERRGRMERAEPLQTPTPVRSEPSVAPMFVRVAPPFALPAVPVMPAARSHADAPQWSPAAAAAVAPAAPPAVAPTGNAQQAGIDLTRDPGLHRMIDRIEVLRDAADATDTRIRLVPDRLGPVDVSVQRDGDAVTVHFTAPEAATRQLIADAQPRLAELAEARGVRIDRATVDGGTGSGGEQRQPNAQPAPRPTTNRLAATAAADDYPNDRRIA